MSNLCVVVTPYLRDADAGMGSNFKCDQDLDFALAIIGLLPVAQVAPRGHGQLESCLGDCEQSPNKPAHDRFWPQLDAGPGGGEVKVRRMELRRIWLLLLILLHNSLLLVLLTTIASTTIACFGYDYSLLSFPLVARC